MKMIAKMYKILHTTNNTGQLLKEPATKQSLSNFLLNHFDIVSMLKGDCIKHFFGIFNGKYLLLVAKLNRILYIPLTFAESENYSNSFLFSIIIVDDCQILHTPTKFHYIEKCE